MNHYLEDWLLCFSAIFVYNNNKLQNISPLITLVKVITFSFLNRSLLPFRLLSHCPLNYLRLENFWMFYIPLLHVSSVCVCVCARACLCLCVCVCVCILSLTARLSLCRMSLFPRILFPYYLDRFFDIYFYLFSFF